MTNRLEVRHTLPRKSAEALLELHRRCPDGQFSLDVARDRSFGRLPVIDCAGMWIEIKPTDHEPFLIHLSCFRALKGRGFIQWAEDADADGTAWTIRFNRWSGNIQLKKAGGSTLGEEAVGDGSYRSDRGRFRSPSIRWPTCEATHWTELDTPLATDPSPSFDEWLSPGATA